MPGLVSVLCTTTPQVVQAMMAFKCCSACRSGLCVMFSVLFNLVFLLCFMLQVVQAMNGFEALQYMEEADSLPDIILLDVMMPGMSGYEVRHGMQGRLLP